MGGIKNDTIPKTYVGDGSTIDVSGNVISSYDPNQLGEVKLFALSMSGAVTKATLQGKGWAICDGTTPASQGISTPTITTTPNLEHKFLRMSDDESSGDCGGSETHNHQITYRDNDSQSEDKWVLGVDYYVNNNYDVAKCYDSSGSVLDPTDLHTSNDRIDDNLYTNKIDTKPPYYELAYFMKVK